MNPGWNDEKAVADLRQKSSPGQAGGHWLFQQYSERLLNFLMSPRYFGLCHADAEDVLQESFLRAFKYIQKFDPAKSGFYTWLNAIAVNECKKFLSASGKREHLTDPLPDEEMMDTGPDLETRLCYYYCVTRGLTRFEAKSAKTKECIKALTLKAEGGYIEEIAREIGRTKRATTVFLAECKKKLKPYLAHCDEECKKK